MKIVIGIVIAVFWCVGTPPLWANTHAAASCSETAVVTAISLAANGDTVTIPAGVCTWTSTLTITKAITLQGAGCTLDAKGRPTSCSTVINDGVASTYLIVFSCVTNGSHRLTGIGFQDGGRTTDDGNGIIVPTCVNSGPSFTTSFRIDHNEFNNLHGRAIFPRNMVGVIDHNTFLSSSSYYTLSFKNGSWDGVGDFGDASWNKVVTWGSPFFCFVEDNTFTFTPGANNFISDSFQGARTVFRFNDINGAFISVHGTESGQRDRGGIATEIYMNTMDFTGAANGDKILSLRSGSALIWDNTAKNMNAPSIVAALTDYRTVSLTTPWGSADGTNVWDVNDRSNPYGSYKATGSQNNTIGNTSTVTVKGANWTLNRWAGFSLRKTSICLVAPCVAIAVSNTSDTITFLIQAGFNAGNFVISPGETFDINRVIATLDMPGRGGGSLLSGGSGAVAPAVPSGWNNQVDFPVYQWLNTADGANFSMGSLNDCPMCTENQHFFNYTASFNGSAGVGSGPIARRPSTCTAGVTYWATDQGSWNTTGGPDGVLYKCAVTNTWSLFYTPYSYPHPLTGGASVTSVTAGVAAATVTAPAPGNSGTITAANIGISSLTLNWAMATDSATAQTALQYEVFQSNTNNIATVANAEANGTLLQAFTANTVTRSVTGLTPGTTYFFNVVVKDAAGNKAAYTANSQATLAAPPVPGNSGTITAANIGISSLTLNWAMATDSATAQTALQYEVFQSNTNNIATVANAEANGTLLQAFTANTVTRSVTGLSPSTTYFFNVVVKDAAGNKAAYTAKSQATLAAPPAPGNSGTITAANIGISSLTLNWAMATDSATVQTALQYEVFQSNTNNIATVANAEANGTPLQAFTANTVTRSVTGLTPSTTYFFNVVVKDAAGNKAAYTSKSQVTLADTVPPVPGNSGTITAVNIGTSSLTLNWSMATDNWTAQTALQYEVFQSRAASNIATAANAEVNGTLLQAFTANTGTRSLTGLTPGTTYFFNVIVKDAAGNKAAYTVKSQATLADTVPPAVSLTTPVSGALVSELQMLSAKATDNVGVAGVQFKLDGVNVSSEVTTATTLPATYSIYWNTITASIGSHTLTAVARDASGNRTTSAPVTISVSQTAAPATPANGGGSLVTTAAANSPVTTSYAIAGIQTNVAQAGTAIVGWRTGGVLVSETGVAATSPMSSGSVYVTVGGSINTGLAMANPTSQDALISYNFTDSAGNNFGAGSFTLKANNQIAAFLNQAPFNIPNSIQGTLIFNSPVPVGVIGLRGLTNERGEFLVSTLPVAPAGSTPTGLGAMLPHFVDGGGWTSQVVLTNSSDSPESGTVQFFGQGSTVQGAFALRLTVNGTLASTFNYSIPPHASALFITAGVGTTAQVGSVRITPGAGGSAPATIGTYSFKNAGITVSEFSISAQPLGSAFQVYLESSGNTGQIGSVRSGLAISSASSDPVVVNVSFTRMDGTSMGSSQSIILPPQGQMVEYPGQLFPGLPAAFEGFASVTAAPGSMQSPIAVTAARGRYNERGDYLVSATPALNEASAPATEAIFPFVVSGGGYTTQFILFGQTGAERLSLFSQNGTLSPASSLTVGP